MAALGLASVLLIWFGSGGAYTFAGLGLFFVGWIVDLFLMPGLERSADRRYLSGPKHYTVAWVTTSRGTFIKSLRKQGPSSWTSSQWGSQRRRQPSCTRTVAGRLA